MTEPEAGDKPTLIATGGPMDGTVFVVDPGRRETSLGSAMTVHVRMDLSNVEPDHAVVTIGGGGLRLSDMATGTGTYVNGEKIDQDHLLNDGDRICLGPPGSKNSAKLLVHIPHDWSPPADDLVLVPPKPEVGLEPVPERPAPPPPPPPPPPPAAPEAFLPPPPPPPLAAPPAIPPPPPPSAEAKRKPEYTDEQPSILGSHREEPSRPSPAPPITPPKDAPAKKKVVRRGRRSQFPIVPVLVALGIVGLAAGGYWAATNLFKKVPVVQGVVPPKVEPGRSITITGTGFESDASRNTVRVGDQVGAVTAATDTQLTVTVPANLPSAVVPVLVETRTGKSNPSNLTLFRPPQVTGVTPDVAQAGETVVITGSNLDGQPLSVNIGGLAAEVKESEPGTLRVVVPAVPAVEGKTIPVNVQIGGDSAKPAQLLLGRLPMVLEMAPPQGAAGTRVILKGRGFDVNAAGNAVTFGGEPALVLQASANELTVAVPNAPAGETQAKVPVVVKANGAASSGSQTFVATRLSATTFAPHFFAVPVPDNARHDLVFVATDLGPILVLGGKGGALSTAERAVQTIGALNALVKRPEAPVFEFRAEPEPSVGVVGTPAAILTATAEDVAAYGRGWEGAKAGRRPSPRFLAQYWTALLQDYVTLFVTRQRPIKVLELSPRGKVLADLYAEAVRSAGAGAGVPTRLLVPPSPALAKGLREMALLLPAEGQSHAGATIEGRWDGTVDEGGATRKVQVRFRYEGSRLTGSLSSRRGTLDMNTPLRDVALDKSAVRFAVDLSGAALYFRGTVEGETMSGTIAKNAGARSPAGSFTLKFVE